MSDKKKKVAELQDQLFNIGAFQSGLSYQRAVDGIQGKLTNAALAKAKKMGYTYDSENNQLVKESENNRNVDSIVADTIFDSNAFPVFGPESTKKYYSNPIFSSVELPSGLDAITFHKKRLNVQNPYWVLDKKTNTLMQMQGDKVLKSQKVANGWNTESDAADVMNAHEFTAAGGARYDKVLGTTPAGVFTFQKAFPSPYKENGVKMPARHLIETTTGTIMPHAVHAIPGGNRIDSYNNGQYNISYGCISPGPGEFADLASRIQTGDTIYILPGIEGNRMIERNGQLGVEFGQEELTDEIYHERWKGKGHTSKVNYFGWLKGL